MATPRRPGHFLLTLMMTTMMTLRVQGDGDFDLADALEDPDPTSATSGGGLYPKLPQDRPLGDGGNIYPQPRPRPRPQPRPQPRPHPGDADGTFGGSGGHGGEIGGAAQGDTQGNPVAAIVSPVVSVVVLALLGAGVSYFRSGRGGCLRSRGRDTEAGL
ncbi:glycoprotein Xg isoform X6 [Meriones unguiculatus]|uniref:glycoprotein Xg isoform X6 n=1 Tax=Meriones unguiculatus TaxID=10047 RepID=UPI000B4F2B48|nr:glycoprotein Xg isoform X4 [Meriones unguiculatus]XP_060230815.1 glycoprotein Xg isoform X6 [Meriones unguiculatus]